jgi:mannosyltransferase
MFQFLIQHSPLLYLTQSLWRDEAFSVLMALRPVSFIVSHVSFEPPVYYLLLHYWIKLFGQSEIALRSLSLVAVAAATGVVIMWAEKLFRKQWLSWWLPVFFFFNPMLLYYGMEGRTYGWYILFAVLSLFAYTERRWVVWTIATVLGFYTHSYFLIVPFAQVVHYLLTTRIHWKKDPMIRAGVAAMVCIAPWFVVLIRQSSVFGHLWYFPVDLNLVTSVLGNLFVGYEGTPWYLWTFTKVLSLPILLFVVLALRSHKTRISARIFAAQIFFPLFVVIGISFIKPLYVNRYVIPVSIAEVVFLARGIRARKNTTVQKIAGVLWLLFVLGFNIWYPNKHAKVDIRAPLTQINMLKSPTDVVIADNPLVFFETIYYSTDRNRVYLYNPDNNPFPWYVGGPLVTPSQMVSDYPPYPVRAFMVHTNGTFDVVFRTAL